MATTHTVPTPTVTALAHAFAVGLRRQLSPKTLREVFRLFLQVPTLADLVGEIAARGWRNKRWTNREGKLTGGGPLDKPALRHLLRSPLFVGEIRAGEQVAAAEHDPILDHATWDKVQAKLMVKVPRVHNPKRAWTSLLGGLLACGCGTNMVHHHTKGTRCQYHFYVCGKHVSQRAGACPGSRVRMDELDAFVLAKLCAMGENVVPSAALSESAEAPGTAEGPLDEAAMRRTLAALTPLWAVMQLGERQRVLRLLLERVTYAAATREVELRLRDSGLRTLEAELARGIRA